MLEEFRRVARESCLEAGDFLWQEGDPGGEVVLLEEGCLEVMLEAEDGQVVVLRCLEPESLLGEMSCFDLQPHSATVRARVHCRLRTMSTQQFREVARRHPEFLEVLLGQQSERVRSLGAQVARLAFEPVVRRVTRFLLENTAGEGVLHCTHQEIAMQVAATRESVSKALGALARRGVVRLGRGRVEVTDRAGLEAEAP